MGIENRANLKEGVTPAEHIHGSIYGTPPGQTTPPTFQLY